MVAGTENWNLKAILSGALACMLAWCFGASNGLAVGHASVVKRAQAELDAYYAKANKDITEFKAKINRRVAEGDEWKQGSAQDDLE